MKRSREPSQCQRRLPNNAICSGKFKSDKKLSKLVDYKEINFFKNLSQNYKDKIKINTKFGKNTITLYKKKYV